MWSTLSMASTSCAQMVESVDTRDLKSLDHCGRTGSSPVPGTIVSDEGHPMTYTAMSWDDFVQSLVYDPEDMAQEDWILYLEHLERLHAHPMDINNATPEEMARIPFLTPGQIEAIQAYVHLDGPMKSLGELSLIYGIDYETCRVLPLFLTVTDNAASHESDGGKGKWFGNMLNRVDSRLDIPLYYRRGHLTGKYCGNPLYSRVRYSLESDHVQLGAHIEKDPGERFPDSYGGYASISDRGILRRAIAGDYRAGWGEGLVIGRGFYIGKGNISSNAAQGIRPMTSTSESGFFRGIAFTLAGPHQEEWRQRSRLNFSGTLMVSYRTLDATLNDDGEAQTIIDDGYHRTENELSKKNNTHSLLTGMHLQTSWGHFVVGATGYWQHFYRLLSPGSQTYRRWYPRGQDFGAMGLHGSYSGYRWTASAEIAYSTNYGGIATLGKVWWQANRNLKFGVLGRYYSHKYYSFQASAVCENSRVQNETGLLLRMDCRPLDWLSLVTWADFFADYWPRYNMTSSSRGQEAMIEGTFSISSGHTLSLRYQLKRKAAGDLALPHHKLRAQWTFLPSDGWKLQSTAMLHLASGKRPGFAAGQLLYGSILRKRQLRFSLMAGYFLAPDYITRVYVYEPSLWNCSSLFASYYGEGVRISTTVRYTFPGSHWMAEAKYSLTHMLDRNRFSSGNQEILSSTRQDISIQVRMEY